MSLKEITPEEYNLITEALQNDAKAQEFTQSFASKRFDIDALIFENDETVGEFLDTSLVSAQGINDVMGIVRIEKICYDLQPYRSAPPRIG